LRILLDECVDARLAREIVGHDVKTVPQMGWSGTPDGPLLGLAEGEFDAFVTTDRNLPFQQNLARFNLAVIVLEARTNRLVDLKSLVPSLTAALSTAAPGRATRVVG